MLCFDTQIDSFYGTGFCGGRCGVYMLLGCICMLWFVTPSLSYAVYTHVSSDILCCYCGVMFVVLVLFGGLDVGGDGVGSVGFDESNGFEGCVVLQVSYVDYAWFLLGNSGGVWGWFGGFAY
jgi:hypothetical protein